MKNKAKADDWFFLLVPLMISGAALICMCTIMFMIVLTNSDDLVMVKIVLVNTYTTPMGGITYGQGSTVVVRLGDPTQRHVLRDTWGKPGDMFFVRESKLGR